jgi:uncharacterized protein YndB with AHSA1/START domain
MMDILHLVPIQADAQSAYTAVTTQAGLQGWWTKSGQATPEEGTTAEFSFENGQVVFRMRVERLQPGEAVEWRVLDPAPPEWAGTRVTWQFMPAEQGIHLLFGHRGWASTDGSFPAINFNWAYYLLSLKDFLERGKGFPHPQAR